jgi:xanthine/CO dehydrogenase XdhC/CoxF family maturation factor
VNSASEFERLYAGVRELEAAAFQRRGALATIVRTHGSTFRRAGTSMLAHDEGVVCALSGGCPESDIIARAKSVIASDRPVIARYNDASAADVLVEAGCGGELDVLIEPLTRVEDVRFLHMLAQMHTQRRAGFMATVFALEDTPLPRPRRLVWNGAVAWSDIDDAQLVDALMQIGLGLSTHGRAIGQRLGTARGTFDVLVESLRPTYALIVIGANPVAVALAGCAGALGWKVVIVDHRDLEVALPARTYFIKSMPATVLQNVPIDAFSSAVVMTFNVERDIAWLQALAGAPLAYLGAIGSRERAERMRAALTGTRIHFCAPAGLDIGAETPEEIGLAVSAEILGVLNARDGGSLGDSPNPIHP